MIALLLVMALAATDEAAAWTPLPTVNDVDYAYRADAAARGGPGVAFTLRGRPRSEAYGFAEMRMDQRLDCAAYTQVILAGRTYDAEGRLLDSREAAQGRRPDPIHRDDAVYAELHRRLCPGQAVPPPRPPPVSLPPPVATPGP